MGTDGGRARIADPVYVGVHTVHDHAGRGGRARGANSIVDRQIRVLADDAPDLRRTEADTGELIWVQNWFEEERHLASRPPAPHLVATQNSRVSL